MPLDTFITRPDFSFQIKQASGDTAFLAGRTHIAEQLKVKNIEIDTANAQLGNFLVYNGERFLPAPSGAYGNTILNGMILSYYTGLTYNISEGKYRINGVTYNYTGGSVTIISGNSTYNRFDVVYVTGYSNTYLLMGNASAAPTVPTLTSTQLEVGIISVPANFTGGTGATVIQTTSATVFEFYNGTGTGIQRSPVSSYNAEAIGDYSFALSRDAKAYGQDTIALGYGTQASGYGQTVVGQFNSPNATDIFIVGNGTSSGSRANAFRVTTGGSTYVTNKLFVSNVEVETTGASSNYALIHDGNKFTPQLLTLQKITESGNTTTNSIGVNQLTGTSIFLSSGFTFISGYNSYSNPSELRFLLADDLGSQESKTDTYQLNYFTENITKGINPLTTGAYSAFTGGPIFGYVRTGTSITVGKESFVKITGITSGDTAIGTVFRNRFETKDYEATNTLDNTTKNIVGTAFFNQINSSKFNQAPVVGTLLETHLLGNQQATFHNEVRNLQLGVFNRAWVYTTSAQTYFDLYINRPIISDEGYNSFGGPSAGGQTLRLNKHAGIFIESREKISLSDVLNRTLNNIPSTVIFENKPWSLFAEADRAYIGSSLVLYSALTLTSTTRGAWLDIDASQATRPHINLSAGTDPSSPQIGDLWWNGTQLYFRKDGSTSVNLLSGGTGSSSTGLTTGTNLGDGVKVLFSSDTTSLSFATLSSQTPSTLRIISSSTGVILFSAVTGSGGSGGGISGLTSAGTGNIHILSSITDNILSYKTISAGTGININEDVDGTLTFITNNYEYMDLTTAQGVGPFKIGQWYRIPVSSRTVTESANPNNYGDIMLIGVDTNKLSVDGYLLAINADYQDVGVYTDADAIVGSTAGRRRGVPYYGQNFTQRDVTIFNNIHWLCTTNFSNTRTLADLQDTNYFTALTKDYTSTYGYIIEVDKITYDLSTDRILSRIDKRRNIIHENNANLILDGFRFGDDNVTDNFIKASNVQNFDVLNIPKNNFIFKDNTLTSFNKLFFNTISSGAFLETGTTIPVYISGVSVNDGKFEAINRITAYNGSINNYKSTIEETLTLTSSSIDLTYKYLTGKITLLSGSSFNTVISSITQIANVLYNVDITFNTQNVSGITFINSDIMKTEGGLSAFISGTTYDTIEFGRPYGNDLFLQKNINNYI